MQVLAVLLVALCAGCSAKADYEKLCQAKLEEKDAVAKELKSNDARRVVQAMAAVSESSQGEVLRHGASSAGVEGCALADLLDKRAGKTP